MANTKLTKQDKGELKAYIRELESKGELTFGYFGEMTVMLFLPKGSRYYKMTLACASPSEDKVRKSVGRKVCLYRMLDGAYLPIPYGLGDDAQYMAEMFSSQV